MKLFPDDFGIFQVFPYKTSLITLLKKLFPDDYQLKWQNILPWFFIKLESCLLALSFLHNLREDGGKKGSSHFDETLILIGHHSLSLENYIS